MRGAGRIVHPRFDLRWLYGSPLLVAACIAGLAATAVLARAMQALHVAGRLRTEIEIAAARLGAEAAASTYVASDGKDRQYGFDLGRGIAVDVRAEPGADSSVHLSASVNGHRLHYSFSVLAGGTPRVFGQPFTVVSGGPSLPDEWPRRPALALAELPELALDHAQLVQDSMLSLRLKRDPGIALLRLAAGTDREDFVFGSDSAEPLRLLPPASGVLVIDGNLWIDEVPRPFEVELYDDLTLVVRGNVYLGRPVRVRGPGHLTIATLCAGGVAFADRDGNGRWSEGDALRSGERFRGPVEGAGSVWFGMPREPGTALELDLGLFVAGELHVAADSAAVHGPVVLVHGVTRLPGREGNVEFTGLRLPELQRAALPGFVTVGGPRPGLLRRVPDPKQPLYAAAPNR